MSWTLDDGTRGGSVNDGVGWFHVPPYENHTMQSCISCMNDLQFPHKLGFHMDGWFVLRNPLPFDEEHERREQDHHIHLEDEEW